MLKIWRVALDDPAHLDPPRLATLDQQEHQRWQSLRKAQDARRYAAAHTALRAILASELACSPSEIQYLHNAWGKPFLAHGPAFSLSHSGPLALIALQSDSPISESRSEMSIGIDIELQSQDTDPSWFVDCWSPAEQRRMSQPLSAEQALRLWVRKEAVLKAVGRGLHLPMSQVVLPLGQSQRMRAISHCEGQSTFWHLYDIDVGQGQFAALASHRVYRQPTVMDWLG
ncbi:MAG: 4'-phosphopantetheinyl transferase superfamily protein [Proteobacteria bacterium]|nr:4'-phosphopantetheinyl transferase superfamily protein [Pseudomonadota bacterium]